MSRRCLHRSLLVAWLAVLMLVVPVGAEDFSFSRCMVAGSRSDFAASGNRTSTPQGGLACLKAQQEYEARRQANEAAQRERQRLADEEATRRQMEAAARETADQAAANEKSRAREDAERVRKAQDVDAARQRKAQQEAARAQGAAPQPPRAEQFMPGPCATADLTAKCAMPQDPVLDQIRKSQENAARGRPNR